jgi:CRP-like cAMP-binding protein
MSQSHNRNTSISTAGNEPASPESRARANAILSRLSHDELKTLLPKFKLVPLKLGEILYEPGDRIDYVYYPLAGIISLLATFEDGTTVEAGLTGNEGMMGFACVLGADTTPHQALVQTTGEALRMTSTDLRAEVEHGGPFLAAMLIYTNMMFVQVAQTAACNRIHTLEQRLARWLLLTDDRVATHQLELTQDFISRMLGVRRAGVTVAANELRQRGIIEYRRGNVIVRDRKGLEQTSCVCYELVKQEYDRYLIDSAPSQFFRFLVS